MSNRLWAIGMAAALGLATVAVEVSARGLAVSAKGGVVSAKGLGLGGHHAFRHHHKNRTFGHGYYGGYYGGLVVAGQAIGSEPVGSTPQTLPPVIPLYALQCTRSEEIKVVPSEEGGTREITIRRC